MITTQELEAVAAQAGAPVSGVAEVSDLPRDRTEMVRMLPEARSIIVLATPHSRSAISSANVQAAQYDTKFTYEEVARASHVVVRWLAGKGHRAVAVPAFLPIDMSPGKNGMRGAVDLREAGVQAGIGGHGDCGLLVTPEFGTAVRLGAVLTDARMQTTGSKKENPCTHCGLCVEACPVRAIGEGGAVDKSACGKNVFQTGFRAWRKFLSNLLETAPEERRELLGSQTTLDLWQNFMTGNYYSCWACQSACPVGDHALPAATAKQPSAGNP